MKAVSKNRFLLWLSMETRGFLGGLIGGLASALAAFAYLNNAGRATGITASDAIAIANTYIVYATFVFTSVAVLLAIAGFIFTQHFSIEKEEHMAHAFDSIRDIVRSDEDKAVKLIQSAMENPDVIDYVSNALGIKLDQVIAQRRAGARETARSANEHAETLETAFSDLSASEKRT